MMIGLRERWSCQLHVEPQKFFPSILKLAIHLSFLAFRYVRALFREIANQSLYTSHNITDFVHLWFCEKLDEKLVLLSSLTFRENTDCLARTAKRGNVRWEEWLMRPFRKCHLYTSRFANIFSRYHQFDDKCIAGFSHTETYALHEYVLYWNIHPFRVDFMKPWLGLEPATPDLMSEQLSCRPLQQKLEGAKITPTDATQWICWTGTKFCVYSSNSIKIWCKNFKISRIYRPVFALFVITGAFYQLWVTFTKNFGDFGEN